MPPFTPVSSERTTVRPVHRNDLHELLAINGDDAVTKFLPYRSWQTAADADNWYNRMQALAEAGTGVQLVIAHRSVNDAAQRVIGSVLLFKFDVASARAEVGYVLGRAYWRQGLAHEALRAVMGQAFGALGLRRIEAEVNPDNRASCALLCSLGFVLEGQLRQRWAAKGVTYDTHLYGCLAQDWEQANDAELSAAPG